MLRTDAVGSERGQGQGNPSKLIVYLLLLLVHPRPNLIHDLRAHRHPWEDPVPCRIRIPRVPRVPGHSLNRVHGRVGLSCARRLGNATEWAVSPPTPHRGRTESIPHPHYPRAARRAPTKPNPASGISTARTDQNAEPSPERTEQNISMQNRMSEMLPSVCRGGGAQPYTHLWGVPSGAPEITRNKCTSWGCQGGPQRGQLERFTWGPFTTVVLLQGLMSA